MLGISRVTATAMLATAVATACAPGGGTGAATHTHSPRPIPPAPTRAATPPAVPPAPGSPAGTPEHAALLWLTANHSRSWRDPSPTAWIDRAAPYSTGAVAAAQNQARAGTPGADWPQFVAAHCIQSTASSGSVIPPAAPRTPDLVYVQVRAMVIRDCADERETHPVAATVATRRDGPVWRVSDRIA